MRAAEAALIDATLVLFVAAVVLFETSETPSTELVSTVVATSTILSVISVLVDPPAVSDNVAVNE